MYSKSIRRSLAVGIGGLLALASVAGCSGGQAAPAPSGAPQSGLSGRGPITYVTGRDSSGAAQQSVERWNSAHPDEKVTIVELPDAADQQRQQLIQNAQIKSDAFTVLNVDIVWVSEFAANRWLVALPEDALQMDKAVPAVVEAGKYRDTLYAAPYYPDGALLYYRSDLLKAAGVANPPKTWDEMKSACEKVLALAEAKGMSCYAGQMDKGEALTVNFSEAVNSAGGALFDDQGKPTINTPEAKAGLTFLVEGLKSGLMPPEAITFKEEEGRRAFQEGKLVFHRNWPGPFSSFSKSDGSSPVAGKFGVAPIPGKDGVGASTLGGHYLGISPFAKNQQTAMDFIAFFVGEEEEEARLSVSSRAPIYNDLFKAEKRAYLPELLTSLEKAEPRPRVVRYGDTTTAIQNEAYAALKGEKSVDQALADMQKALEAIK